MSSSPQQRRCQSPSPQYYIDLTVDSPVSTRSKSSKAKLPTKSKNKVNHHENLNENIIDETIVIDDSDSGDRNQSDIDVIEYSVQDHQKTKCSDSNYSNKQLSSAISCPICLEDLLNSSIKALTTKCGHIFCDVCIQNSLLARKKCPVCLTSITLKSCIRLHI